MAKVVRLKKQASNNWREAIQDFIYWKQAHGLSETTVNDYRYHLNQFFKRYPGAKDPRNLKSNILNYMAQPMKPATYNLRLIYLKTFFSWCIDEGILLENPLEGFKKRKDEGRIVNLDTDTITKLISLPDKKTYAGMRGIMPSFC
jgi:site-specific recombinase XerD